MLKLIHDGSDINVDSAPVTPIGGAISSGGPSQPIFPPPQTSPSSTGDVILSPSSPSSPRSNKKPLIISILFSAIIIIAIVVVYISRKIAAENIEEKIEIATIEEAFNGYYSLLVYGQLTSDGERMVDTNEWYIENLLKWGSNADEEDKYLENLKFYYDAFWNFSNQTDDNTIFYNDLFTLYYNCANRNRIMETISDLSQNNKKDAAEKYIDNLIKGENLDGILKTLADYEKEYFNIFNKNSMTSLASMLDIIETMKYTFKTNTEDIRADLGRNHE